MVQEPASHNHEPETEEEVSEEASPEGNIEEALAAFTGAGSEAASTEEAVEESAGSAGEDLKDQRIAQLEEELAKSRDNMLRAVADAENARRRALKDVEEATKFSVSGFAKDMIDVLENLQRALDTITPEDRENNVQLSGLGEGVELTLQELLKAFERHGIHRIYPIGEKFDHNLHQAVVQIDDPSTEAGTVVQVIQAGYTIHDRLLRPAMVGVSKGGPQQHQVDTEA